jgi:hypothetical protein
MEGKTSGRHRGRDTWEETEERFRRGDRER